MDTDIVTLIQNVGFPIAVASYVLFRMNGKIGKLTDAVKDNTDATKALSEAVRPR